MGQCAWMQGFTVPHFALRTWHFALECRRCLGRERCSSSTRMTAGARRLPRRSRPTTASCAPSSGESALAMLMREEVDAMLLDVDQPGISGFEMLRIARENFELTEVVITAAAVRRRSRRSRPSSSARSTSSEDGRRRRGALADRSRARAAGAGAPGPGPLGGGRRHHRARVRRRAEPRVHDVVDLVRRVASLSATVLVLGESGTGKELLARRLHRESQAPDGPFVAVNLAAIPQELVESVLFGHEKGSFTGAVRQQIGKFELADGGTLFLDEIGDLRAGPAVQAAARDPGRRDRADWQSPADQGDLPADRGDERGPREGGQRRALPGRPLLSNQRHPDQAAAPARAR